MNRNKKLYMMILTGLLIAIGIVIPMVSPIKVVIEPMSFTLASHVAIMIAIFISPTAALAVALGTTLGFFLAGFPITVVLRALSHVVWAGLGAMYATKHPETFESPMKTLIFNVALALLHAVCEVLIVIPFYTSNSLSDVLYLLFGLVGLGTIIHSFVDFTISLLVWKALAKNKSIVTVANVKQIRFSSH